MIINIEEEALKKIKSVLKSNNFKYPRIILRKGGCAGSMLVLTLDEKRSDDVIVNSYEIEFCIESAATEFIQNITICSSPGLGSEIIIKNENYPTCTCGKSFKI